MSDRIIEPDQFAASLSSIFGDIERESSESLNVAVKEGARVSSNEWRSNARSKLGGTGKYASSVRFRVDRTGEKPKATVYSTMPGLPHLLEKGHAKMGGGRVSGREHIAPAADKGFDAAMETLSKEVDKRL